MSIKLDNHKLIPVDNIKYLGMYLDTHLSWDVHIKQLSLKLSRANGILSKLRHFASVETCLQLYYAIFHSQLTYGCILWGLSSKSNIEIISKLQKKCIIIMTSSDFNSHTNQLFIDLKLLKVNEIISSQQLKLIYEFNNNLLPSDLNDLFRFNTGIHKYPTRSANREQLCIPMIRTTNYGIKSIIYSGLLLWNQLLRNKLFIDQPKSVSSFKVAVKNNYLGSYSSNKLV